MSDEGFVAIESKLDALAVGQKALADGQNALARDLRGEIADLGNQMRVLHEDTIANIKALAPDFEPIRREFLEADAKLKEEILEQLARGRRRD